MTSAPRRSPRLLPDGLEKAPRTGAVRSLQAGEPMVHEPVSRVCVQMEVRNFYPWLRGSSRFGRLGSGPAGVCLTAERESEGLAAPIRC